MDVMGVCEQLDIKSMLMLMLILLVAPALLVLYRQSMPRSRAMERQLSRGYIPGDAAVSRYLRDCE